MSPSHWNILWVFASSERNGRIYVERFWICWTIVTFKAIVSCSKIVAVKFRGFGGDFVSLFFTFFFLGNGGDKKIKTCLLLKRYERICLYVYNAMNLPENVHAFLLISLSLLLLIYCHSLHFPLSLSLPSSLSFFYLTSSLPSRKQILPKHHHAHYQATHCTVALFSFTQWWCQFANEDSIWQNQM